MKPPQKPLYWYGGKLIEGETISLQISQPGLIYGATIFTTLRVYQQRLDHPLTHWPDHINRLKTSLNRFGWRFEHWERLREGATQLASIYPILRMVIFPDGQEWITGRFLPANLLENQQGGIEGWIADEPLFSRPLENYKTGNYLGAWLGLQKAQQMGAKEGILVDTHGHWLETCTGNLWGWKEGKWYTPPKDYILGGIVRSQLLKWLKQQQITVEETPWLPSWIEQWEVVAYSNCGVEIIPFRKILWGEQGYVYNPSHEALNLLRDYFRSQLN